MADDSSNVHPIFPQSAAGFVAAFRETASIRTLFTTEHRFDAEQAGFDYPVEPGTEGGFSVLYDGRHDIPSVVITGSDGSVEVCGYAAIQQLASALLEAESMARRQAGVA